MQSFANPRLRRLREILRSRAASLRTFFNARKWKRREKNKKYLKYEAQHTVDHEKYLLASFDGISHSVRPTRFDEKQWWKLDRKLTATRLWSWL
jgi:hypothetical protein